MKSIAMGLTLVLSMVAWSPARAEDDRVAEAQRHYETGMANYHLEEYDKAIQEWEAGFRLKPAPQFLFNIAQAYRLSHRSESALAFYQKYLRLSPDAENRTEVTNHIETLKQLIEQQRQADERPSTQPMPVRPNEPATALTASPPAPERPAYRKKWVWAVAGAGAVVLAGAITLGVVLGTRGTGEQTLPVARF